MAKRKQIALSAVDRFADSAAPKVGQLGDSVAAAKAALDERADQRVSTRGEWAEGLRSKVCSLPLAAMAAAVALGALIVRITR
jgi:hypothetical protein